MTIDELEVYFNNIELPETVQLHRAITITNTREYVNGNILRARIYGENPLFGTAYKDLLKLKEFLEKEQ